jgi:tetratricopeptide (TPR) repeat protein
VPPTPEPERRHRLAAGTIEAGSSHRNRWPARWGLPAIVLGLALVVYLNAIPNGFVFDDVVLISQNREFRESALREREWLAWFGRYYWWGAKNAAVDLYRPVTILSYVANLRAFGLDPKTFHAMNLALHAVVSVLVLALGQRLIGRWAAFLGAALFAVHPLHTEAVSSIVGRAELLAALFGLAALLCALRAARPEESRWISFTVVALVFFALGLLSKEHVATLPVWLALALFAGSGNRLTRRSGLLLVLFFATAIAHVLLWRAVVIAWGGPSPVHELNNPTVAGPAWQRWLTAAAVTFRYAWLFVWPARLSPDYSYAEIVPSRTVGTAEAAGLLLIMAVLLTAAGCYRRHRGLALTIAFVPVAFFVVSNFPFPIGTIMGERLTYLPSVGACLAAGWALSRIGWPERLGASSGPDGGADLPAIFAPGLGWRARAALGLCIVAILGYGVRTLVRNPDWRDQVALFESARAVSTRSFKIKVNLARAALEQRRPEVAKSVLEEALRLSPRPDVAAAVYLALGDTYVAMGQPERSIDAYRSAIDSPPKTLPPYFALAQAYMALGRPELALEQYRIAGADFPDAVEPRHNLGSLLWRMGRKAEAEQYLLEALRLKPDYSSSRIALGGLLLATGRPLAAVEQFEAALRLKPNDPRALYGMAQATQRLGRDDAAREYARRAAAAGLQARDGDPGRFFEPVTRPQGGAWDVLP